MKKREVKTMEEFKYMGNNELLLEYEEAYNNFCSVSNFIDSYALNKGIEGSKFLKMEDRFIELMQELAEMEAALEEKKVYYRYLH